MADANKFCKEISHSKGRIALYLKSHKTELSDNYKVTKLFLKIRYI